MLASQRSGAEINHTSAVLYRATNNFPEICRLENIIIVSMPPKRANRHDVALRAPLASNAQIADSASNSQVAPLGNVRLTNARGEPTPARRHYQSIAREQNFDDSLDPWQRGTITRGQSEYTTRRSGKEQVVGRWRNGILRFGGWRNSLMS